MNPALPLALSIAAFAAASAGEPPNIRKPKMSAEAIIDYGKAIDVARLDPSLPSKPLGEWFFSIVGSRIDFLQWTATACGSAPDNSPDTPLCIQGEAKWRKDRAAIVVTIEVGVATLASSSPNTEPLVFTVGVWTAALPGVSDATIGSVSGFWDTRRLGELSDILVRAEQRAKGLPAKSAKE